MLAAMVIWGLSPLYYALLSHVPPVEVVAHRILWSLPMVIGYALWTGRGRRAMAEVARNPRLIGLLTITTILVAANWLTFVYSIQIGKTSESSFGYFIYPLLAVVLGRILLGERISPLQSLAAAIAGAAVLWLALRFDTLPWIALLLAITFAVYSLVRKMISTGPLVGVAWEFLIVSGPLIGYLIWHGGGIFGTEWYTSLVLIGSAFFTGIPLVLFIEASKRLAFSTNGVLFYLNPSLQFVCALLLGEAIDQDRLLAFAAIWVAVILYCIELRRRA